MRSVPYHKGVDYPAVVARLRLGEGMLAIARELGITGARSRKAPAVMAGKAARLAASPCLGARHETSPFLFVGRFACQRIARGGGLPLVFPP